MKAVVVRPAVGGPGVGRSGVLIRENRCQDPRS